MTNVQTGKEKKSKYAFFDKDNGGWIQIERFKNVVKLGGQYSKLENYKYISNVLYLYYYWNSNQYLIIPFSIERKYYYRLNNNEVLDLRNAPIHKQVQVFYQKHSLSNKDINNMWV